MDLSLIKFASVLNERAALSTSYLTSNSDFQRLVKLIPPTAVRNLITAFTGDIKEHERAKGKKIDSLFALMLKPSNFERKFKVELTPEISKLIGKLSGMALEVFDEYKNYTGGDKWGNEFARGGDREDKLYNSLSFDEIEEMRLYEELKREYLEEK